MLKKSSKFKWVTAVFLGIGLLSGCGGGDSDSPDNELENVTNLLIDYADSFVTGMTYATPLSSALGGKAETVGGLFLDLKDGLDAYFTYYGVKTYAVTYTVEGHEPLSGLAVVPVDLLDPGKPLTLPMISLQHPTQVLRSQSPSLVSKFKDEELTVPFATMLAAMGYIVVVPDYPGMGINQEVHPYCMKSLAKSVTGFITAADNGNQPWSSRVTWDGRLFLIGFSEGGYATLVAAQDIQENTSYNLVGVAALDGPYSLSGTMRGVMQNAQADFQAPYFLPYVVAAYGDAYGSESTVMKFSEAVISPLNQILPPMLTGAFSGEEISTAMKQGIPYEGPSSILSSSYLADLGNDGSSLVTKLKENNAFNWTPKATVKVLLYHDKNDDLVPFGNFEEVLQSAWGGLSNITFDSRTEALPLGSVHAGALIPAYIRGASWIHDLELATR